MRTAGSRATRVVMVQAVAALVILAASPVLAQSPERAAGTLVDAIHLVAADLGDPRTSEPSRQPHAPATRPVVWAQEPAPRRPAGLLPLYASFALLQAMDAHSTVRAVRGGAVERNPLIQPFGRNAGAMFAIKGATTVGTIALSEKLWRRHRVGAVVVMAVANVAYGAIVAANYRR